MMNSRPPSRNSPGCQSSSVGTWTQPVQVGDDAAVEAQREGARRLAEVEHVEDDGAAFLGELGAGAEALRRKPIRPRHVPACRVCGQRHRLQP